MKLASFRYEQQDCIGFQLDENTLVDVAAAYRLAVPGAPVPADMFAVIGLDAIGRAHLHSAHQIAVAGNPALPRIASKQVLWHPPVRKPSKVVCLALNNRALDAIKIRAPTDHPAFFLKPATALTGHLQPIRLRASYGLTHPEPELGVIIGSTLRNSSPAAALAAVFGYTIVNDVTSVGMREEDSFSVRYFKPDPATGSVTVGEAHTSYPGRYKASDSFAPMGPVVVTADEITDPAGLRIRCWLADQLVAADCTRNYVWDVPNALAHVSRTMTLLPGDIVSMGTAVGGNGDDPQAPQVPGVTRANLQGLTGVVTVSIDGIGALINPVAMED